MHENFKTLKIADFVGNIKSDWCEELIMQFYAIVHFYPDGKIKWIIDGTRYESSVNEWADLLGLPPSDESFIDVYRTSHLNHDSMKNMYKDILVDYQDKWRLGSVYYLLPGLATVNSILRVTLMPKSGDDRMITGYSIDMLQILDNVEMFNFMDLIVEMVKRTTSDHKHSWGYAPYIQLLINFKVGNNVYLLESKNKPF